MKTENTSMKKRFGSIPSGRITTIHLNQNDEKTLEELCEHMKLLGRRPTISGLLCESLRFYCDYLKKEYKNDSSSKEIRNQ